MKNDLYLKYLYFLIKIQEIFRILIKSIIRTIKHHKNV